MKVKEIMCGEFVRIESGDSIGDALKKLRDGHVGLVFTNGKYEGLVTETSVLKRGFSPRTTVIKVTERTPKPGVGEEVSKVALEMVRNDLDALPVLKGDKVVGAVYQWDLIKDVIKGEFPNARVSEVMHEHRECWLRSGEPIGKALKVVKDKRVKCIYVVNEKGEPQGFVPALKIFRMLSKSGRGPGPSGGPHPSSSRGMQSSQKTERDVQQRTRGEKLQVLKAKVDSIMEPVGKGFRPDDKLTKVTEELVREQKHSVPILDNGKLAGIVTPVDLLQMVAFTRADKGFMLEIAGHDVDPGLYEEIQTDVKAMLRRYERLLGNFGQFYMYIKRGQEKMRRRRQFIVKSKLFTEKTFVVAEGEGFGIELAFHDALDKLDRQLRKEKARLTQPPKGHVPDKKLP